MARNRVLRDDSPYQFGDNMHMHVSTGNCSAGRSFVPGVSYKAWRLHKVLQLAQCHHNLVLAATKTKSVCGWYTYICSNARARCNARNPDHKKVPLDTAACSVPLGSIGSKIKMEVKTRIASAVCRPPVAGVILSCATHKTPLHHGITVLLPTLCMTALQSDYWAE